MEDELNNVMTDVERITGKKFTKHDPPSSKSKSKSYTKFFKNIYMYVFLGVFIFLLIFKPTFVYDYEDHKYKFNFLKFISYTFIISVSLIVMYYAYIHFLAK